MVQNIQNIYIIQPCPNKAGEWGLYLFGRARIYMQEANNFMKIKMKARICVTN